jgi:hypothetical protein
MTDCIGSDVARAGATIAVAVTELRAARVTPTEKVKT